jgi:transcriptional regulator with XRE-family HTH domain
MSEQKKDWTVAERFGANLTWLRCKAGVSQQELADLTEMHRAQVAALERRRLSGVADGLGLVCISTAASRG